MSTGLALTSRRAAHDQPDRLVSWIVENRELGVVAGEPQRGSCHQTPAPRISRKAMRLSLRHRRELGFALFGLVLAAALAWAAFRSGPLAPVRVTVARVTRGTVAPALFGIGTVEAQRTYLVGPTAAGRIRDVRVDVGDRVRAGQLLAQMEPVDLDARVASSVAATERGRSALATADAQARDAQSRLDLATIEARRAGELAREGVVSQSVEDAAARERQSAEAQLAAAQASLAAARRDLARLQAETGGAQTQRSHLRLLAPVDAIVATRSAEPGSTVVAGQSVVTLIDPRSLWVTVRIDQGRSTGLVTGLPATIVRRAQPDRPLEGRVVRVEPISDPVTEERLARVAFDARPPDATTGEMAEVTLTLPRVTNALVVPSASVRRRGARTGVWTYSDGTLAFAPVTIGAEGLDGRVQILDGLKDGDTIVVYSERDLDEGQRVTAVDALAQGPR